MARINIEDCVLRDNRFADLMIRLGSKRMALGALTEAWMLAQQFYLKLETQRLIPLKVWTEQRMAPEILEVGLAETRPGGVYMCGSEEQFAWLLQRSNAGKKARGGRVARIQPTYDTPNLNKDVMLNGRQRPFNDRHRAPSSSSSSSLTSSSSSIPFGFRKEKKEERNTSYFGAQKEVPNYVAQQSPVNQSESDAVGHAAPALPKQTVLEFDPEAKAQTPTLSLGQQTSKVVARYCELWKLKHPGLKIKPEKKSIGQMKNLVKEHGLDATLELLETYFKTQRRFFTETKYAIGSLLARMTDVQVCRQTGVYTESLGLSWGQARIAANEALRTPRVRNVGEVLDINDFSVVGGGVR